jgi:hypothetical protein
MSAAGDTHFDNGRVVSRAFSVIGRNWIAFLALSILAVLPQMAWNYYLLRGPQSSFGTGTAGMYGLITLGGWVVTIVASFVLQAALTYGTIMDLNGQRASLGEMLGVGLKAFLPLCAIGILYTLGIGVALVALIVPGIILVTVWAVVVPARIAENTGVLASFSRSGELTRGHRWPILGIFAVFYVIVIIADFVIRPLTGLTLFANTASLAAVPLYLVLTGATRVVSAVISSAGIACIYYELRTVKEGIGPEQLASVFE